MAWVYRDNSTETFTLQDGWFIDTFRVFDQVVTYYLFSADGATTYAPGTPGITIASNLPELFNSAGRTYNSFARESSDGDRITIELSKDYSRLDGLPSHPITGKKAFAQSLSSEVEGIYWEGSLFGDTFTLAINDNNPALQAARIVGVDGDDTLIVKGDLSALISKPFIPNFGGTTFWGGNGNDRVVLEGPSSQWLIRRLENEVGFEISGSNTDSSNLYAREVEQIHTDDEIINYNPEIITPRKPDDYGNSELPGLAGIVVDGSELIVEYDDLLLPGRVSRTRFQVKVNGKRIRTSDALVEQDSTVATMNLAKSIKEDDKVVVRYIDPRGDQAYGVLQGVYGADAASFNNIMADIF
jgi:hypothetical protein